MELNNELPVKLICRVVDAWNAIPPCDPSSSHSYFQVHRMKTMNKNTTISNIEVLEFTRGGDIATVVTNGPRVNCYEPHAFNSYATLFKAIAHLEGNGWSILIR